MIKTAYNRYKTRPTGSAGRENRPRKYDDALSFLDERTTHRKTTTNIPHPRSASPISSPTSDDHSTERNGDTDADQNALNLEVNETAESIEPILSHSQAKRRRSGHESSELEKRVVDILEQCVKNSKEPKTASPHAEYGDMVNRVLDGLPKRIRKVAIPELLEWVVKYETIEDSD